MSSHPVPAEGKPAKLKTDPPASYDYSALEKFFRETLDPASMSIFLEEIEEQYISYCLRHPELPGQTAEHQVHYLRALRKALSQVIKE